MVETLEGLVGFLEGFQVMAKAGLGRKCEVDGRLPGLPAK
jgi:hypothetical protein